MRILVGDFRNAWYGKSHSCKMRFIFQYTSSTPLCFIIYFYSTLLPTCLAGSCAGMLVPFEILPPGDMALEYGSPLELYCSFDEVVENKNASDLIFKKDAEILSKEFVSIYNETTIKLYVERPVPGKSKYYCNVGSKTCLKDVVIGYRPQEVRNFSCVSRNWENLTCHWIPPPNPLKTIYRLNITMPGRAGARFSNSCPGELDAFNNTCVFSQYTDPHYRLPYDTFKFNLTGENKLGVNTQTIIFNHYAHVIPNKPDNLTLVGKTYNSISLSWKLPYNMANFPPGVDQRVEYQSQWDSSHIWTVADTSSLNVKKQDHNFTLSHLEYANTLYDIRVSMKSVAAVGDDKWSEPAKLTTRTLPTIPGKAPNTTFGSFYILKGDIYIFWQKIPEWMKNGDNFSYIVTCTTKYNSSCDHKKTFLSEASAKFSQMENQSYLFTIQAMNEVGLSLDSGHIYVPSKQERPHEPDVFTKVAFDGKFYELSWKPVVHSDLSNYTIFWCEVDKANTSICKDNLNWVHINKNLNIYNVSIGYDAVSSEAYQFAIAANFYNGSSSGFVWSTCNLFHTKSPELNSFVVTGYNSRSVNLTWSLGCSDNNYLVKGFIIYYCANKTPTKRECKDDENSFEISNPSQRSATVFGLKPYTTYMIRMAVRSNNGEGIKSGFSPFTTLEDAPEYPTNLSMIERTSNSITVKWNVPSESNGVLSKYVLYYQKEGENENNITFSAREKDLEVKNYKLIDLDGNSVYSLSLRACTGSTKCSRRSNILQNSTLVGNPSVMEPPAVNFLNSTCVEMRWKPPKRPNGKISYYEVRISLSDRVNESTIKNISAGALESIVNVPDCKGTVHNKYSFSIRAINRDPVMIHRYLPSDWSEPSTVNCYTYTWSNFGIVMFWVAGVVIFIFVVLTLAYFIKRGWARYKKMQDVHITLPGGLFPDELPSGGDDPCPMKIDPWPPKKGEVFISIKGTNLAADEQSLLEKKIEDNLDLNHINNGAANGDSSGCSVGRESVSSSITSNTHVSSDSGAEADSVSETNECINRLGDNENDFESRDKTVLRQRHASAKERTDSCHTPSRSPTGLLDEQDSLIELNVTDIDNDWEPIESIPFEEPYTIVGSKPSTTIPEKGYVTFSDMPTTAIPTKPILTVNNKLPSKLDVQLTTINTSPKKTETSKSSPYVSLANIQDNSAFKTQNTIPSQMTQININNNVGNVKPSPVSVPTRIVENKTSVIPKDYLVESEKEKGPFNNSVINFDMSKNKPSAVYVSIREFNASEMGNTSEDSSMDESGSPNDPSSPTMENKNVKKNDGQSSIINYLPHHVLANGSVPN